jgi:hypothetical protein
VINDLVNAISGQLEIWRISEIKEVGQDEKCTLEGTKVGAAGPYIGRERRRLVELQIITQVAQTKLRDAAELRLKTNNTIKGAGLQGTNLLYIEV